jgi:predicted metalloprotease
MRIRREGESRRALGGRGERMTAPKSRGQSGGSGGGLLGGAAGGGASGLPIGNLGKGGGLLAVIVALVVAFMASQGGGGGTGTTSGNDVVGQRTELVTVDKTTRSSLTAAEVNDLDSFLAATVSDLAVFWTDEFPDVYGSRFEPLNNIFPYDPTGSQRISCGQPLDPNILNSNAIYCPAEDYITWDSNFLVPNFYANFGKSAVGVVLAHEYGHAVQTRGDLDAEPIIRDLQADCFAGAWIRRSVDGDGQVSMGERDLEGALSGFLLLRDPPGAPTDGFSAHGSAFDRVNAFQSGYVDGADRCRDFATVGVEIVDLNLERGDINAGNLPYNDARDAVLADLATFWGPYLNDLGLANGVGVAGYRSGGSGCAGASTGEVFDYCQATSSVVWNEDEAGRLNTAIGDFATGFYLARTYGEAILAEQSITDTDGLIADCLAGVWAGDVAYDSTRPLELTGGDLDEAVAAMLNDPEAGNDAAAFERVASFKLGFFDGGSGSVASVETCRG